MLCFFGLITIWGGGDYQLRSGLAAKQIWVAVITILGTLDSLPHLTWEREMQADVILKEPPPWVPPLSLSGGARIEGARPPRTPLFFTTIFSIPIFLQPTDIVLWYFKLRILLDQIVVMFEISKVFSKLACGKNSFPLIVFSEEFYLGWKGHVLIYHVEEFLKRTGIYTEQCSEAVHACSFKKTYKRYASNEAFEGHGEKLGIAVSSYSRMPI